MRRIPKRPHINRQQSCYVNYGDSGNVLASFEDVFQVVVYSATFSRMTIIWAPKISKTINLAKDRNALTVPFKVGHYTRVLHQSPF